jgi:hypothetical protein
MYRKHILNISGKRSTGFIGEEIAMASNRDTSEETKFEWDAVRVFKIDPEWAARQEAKNGKKLDPYRLGSARCTIMEGDRDRYRVFYAKTLMQVVGIVRSHLPVFYRDIEEQLRFHNAPRTLEYASRTSPMES